MNFLDFKSISTKIHLNCLLLSIHITYVFTLTNFFSRFHHFTFSVEKKNLFRFSVDFRLNPTSNWVFRDFSFQRFHTTQHAIPNISLIKYFVSN